MATLPMFSTIPEAQMAKPKPGSSISSEQRELRAAFEKAVEGVTPGNAGIVGISEDMNARSISMNLRHAAGRLGLEVYGAVVTDTEVQYKVRKPQANGNAAAPAAAAATV